VKIPKGFVPELSKSQVLKKGKHRIVEVRAKIDTGAWRTSIDKTFAKEIGLYEEDNILWTKTVKSSMGKETRPVINLRFYLAGRKIDTIAFIANREGLKAKMIIGRRDLLGFVVDPTAIE
jgi:hypothetical protein